MQELDWEKYNHEWGKYGYMPVSDIEKEAGKFECPDYDNRLIIDIEKDLGAVKFSFNTLLIFFCFSVLLILIFLWNLPLIYANNSINNDVVGKANVYISAEVQSAIGYKMVYSDNRKINLIVYGNFGSGFKITNPSNGELLFSYSGVPGDGVSVEFPKVSNFIFKPNY